MSYDKLKGLSSFSEPTIIETLERNLISFFDYGLLNIGAFVNVRKPTQGLKGGDNHILRKVNDPNYADGRVWQSFRKNWVWENNLSWSTQPINVSGIYVNNIFQPATGVAFSHKIDYPNGRVIFNSPVPAASSVSCEYSYKLVTICNADDNWMRDVQFDSFNSSDSDFPASSGNFTQLPQNRIQFPVAGIQIPDRRNWRGLELGGGSWMSQDAIVYVLAENDSYRDKLIDVFSLQKGKTIYLYNMNSMAKDGKLPLNYDGSINSSGIRNYTTMVDTIENGGYRYKTAYFANTGVQSTIDYNTKVYGGIVKLTLEINMPEI